MLHTGISELLSYLWKYTGSEDRKKRTEITGENGGLQVKMNNRLGGDPDSNSQDRHVLNLSPALWQGLLRYVQKEKNCDHKQASSFLFSCIKDSLPRSTRRMFNGLISMLLLALILLVLHMGIQASDEGFSAWGALALILFAALWLLIVFAKGLQIRQAAWRLSDASAEAVDTILEQTIPCASRTVFASVSRGLGLMLLAGCIGCFALELMPEIWLLTPSQRIAEYYAGGSLLLHMEDAEQNLMWLSSEKAEALLQKKIDELPAGDLDGFLSGVQAARLETRGKFTQEQAEGLADRVLTRHPLTGIKPQYERQTAYLTEIVAAASEGFRKGYPEQISSLPELDPSILKAVGKGMAGMDTGILTASYEALMEKGHDGVSFLHGAVGAVSSIAEAEELLTSAEEGHRAALSGAYAASFTDPDEVLAYLRMAAGLDIPLAQCAPKGISIQMDLGRFLVSGEPVNQLPDEPYTILPLLRTEDSSVCGYDETNAKYQDVRLWTEALAALPANSIPQTAAEADLILLMDHQYVSDGSYHLRYRNWTGEREDKSLAKYSSVQRLSVYDALTGECLLVVDELSRPPEELPGSLVNQIFYEDTLNPGHAFDEIEPYRYGAPDMDREKDLRKEFCEALQSNGGDLSCFLPATE